VVSPLHSRHLSNAKTRPQNCTQTAHANGIYVILDIILNHTGNVFSYAVENDEPPWRGGTYPVAGFNDKHGAASLPFQNYIQNPLPVGRDDAVWPKELQNPACFTQKGRIRNWDYDPEFREGDFFDLKDVNHGFGPDDSYTPSPALLNLCEAYKYWIAAADIDGYRIDTVKHMDIGATRFFVSAIKEFAQTIGKENFFLVGEITGGRERAVNTDPDKARKAWVLVDAGLHPAGSTLKCVYSTNHGDEGALVLTVQRKGATGDSASIELEVPAAGFVVLE